MIAIFGGSFDPIHNGHIALAQNLIKQNVFSQFVFIPCNVSPFKTHTQATPKQRLAMLELAVGELANVVIDPIELNRPSPSYMVDTLKLLKARDPDANYCLVVGCDAFKDFNKWHCYQQISDLANILIVNRPDFLPTFNPIVSELLQQRQVGDLKTLTNYPAKAIAFIELAEHAVSSTLIRQTFAKGQRVDKWLPKAVADYICAHKLYQP